MKKRRLVTNEVEIAKINADVIKSAQRAELIKAGMKHIKHIAIAGIAGSVFYFCIKDLSGKTTMANIAVNILANFKSELLGWGVGGVGVLYGRRQGKLRKIEIERISGENNELRGIVDKNKQSSFLTPQGENRREDKL